MDELSKWPIPDHTRLPNATDPAVEKSPFPILANRLEMDENVTCKVVQETIVQLKQIEHFMWSSSARACDDLVFHRL